ncbi:sensor histidine kinase [Mucilaginibacter sp. X4EP1]|uniref:sensor histidine kinase n=1 Tax=Mucilaginibacter sp. X4EP1 TaxID=2723092 RepID=UPI002168BA80|nr:sensor histidine kinase [Mucilaginibacter sp. X4EP1]MCS3811631.1 sensor histidine kinase YesM [Mucilaginibacter sp. X4EP1]
MRKFFLHFLFWIVFFLMWNRIVNFYISNHINRLYFSALDVSLIIFAFYSIYLYVMPNYLKNKKLGRLILLSFSLTVLLAGVYVWMMTVFLRHMLVPINFHFSWDYTDLQYNRFFIALLGVLAGCFVKLAVDRLEVGRRMEAMEKEQSLAELTYLKAQINPHFLFNSLNSLYTQLEHSPEDAKGTLISIADLLRYQLYECNTDFIPMANEIAYLKNYFNLQSIRNDNCQASLTISGDYEKLQIAPLLLIPFAENAFKYVSDYDKQANFIKVKVDFIDNKLNFYCTNTFDSGSKKSDNNNKGIGITNVKKRLDLIYGDAYSLRIGTVSGLYTIDLMIKLK